MRRVGSFFARIGRAVVRFWRRVLPRPPVQRPGLGSGEETAQRLAEGERRGRAIEDAEFEEIAAPSSGSSLPSGPSGARLLAVDQSPTAATRARRQARQEAASRTAGQAAARQEEHHLAVEAGERVDLARAAKVSSLVLDLARAAVEDRVATRQAALQTALEGWREPHRQQQRQAWATALDERYKRDEALLWAEEKQAAGDRRREDQLLALSAAPTEQRGPARDGVFQRIAAELTAAVAGDRRDGQAVAISRTRAMTTAQRIAGDATADLAARRATRMQEFVADRLRLERAIAAAETAEGVAQEAVAAVAAQLSALERSVAAAAQAHAWRSECAVQQAHATNEAFVLDTTRGQGLAAWLQRQAEKPAVAAEPIEIPSGYFPGPASTDELFQVVTSGFEGPLDLLLFLIRKHKIDVFDIPIAFICEKYLDYIKAMEDLDIDVASEFMLTAAELLLIKSRMLLPKADDVEDEEDDIDPRAELVRRLLEYQKYRGAAADLERMHRLGRDVFDRRAEIPGHPGESPLREVGSFALVEAFNEVLKRQRPEVRHEVLRDTVSVKRRIHQLIEQLAAVEQLSFAEALGAVQTRLDIIVTFLAMLEMGKLRLLKIFQSEAGSIYLRPSFVAPQQALNRLAGYDESYAN